MEKKKTSRYEKFLDLINENTVSWLIWIFTIVFIAIIFATCSPEAKAATPQSYDTIVCYNECIQKIVEIPTANGKSTRLYAVYNNSKMVGNNEKAIIEELIPVSKSIVAYIETCKQTGIKPNLGIKLKNGQIQSIIRYKPIYLVKYGGRR